MKRSARFPERATLKGVLIAATVLLIFSRQARADDATSTAHQSQVVIVVGASGTPEYGEQFADWAGTWQDVAEQAAASMTMIGQSQSGDSSDHDRLQKTLAALPSQSQGTLWLVLIGHGTFARNTSKFNLRGPDVSATELAEWLQDLKRTVVVVNCASASGPFINRLSGENRVIVTATQSGTEQNFARFGEFIARAITSPDSDLDHDDEVSIHEAFLRASAGVQQFYNADDRISTEHALIDDNGDGRGTPATMFRGTRPIGEAKDGATLDGSAAEAMTLAPADARLPFTQAELDQRRELETQLVELRQRKPSLVDVALENTAIQESAYDAELEPLMLELAKLYQAAEHRQRDAP